MLERVSTELMPDTAVVLSGRLSIREEEEPKLMLDTVEPLYTDAELDQMSENGALSPAVKQLLPGNTLYLRLPSDSAIGMVQPILQRFSGRKPVVLYIESTGAKLRAPQNLFVSPTQELVDTLSDMLGAKNVVIEIRQKAELLSNSSFLLIPLFLVGQRRRVLIELRHIYDVIPHKAMRLAGGRHDLVPRFFLHARVLGENLQFHAVAELANHRRVGQRLFADVRGRGSSSPCR